jgi:hypothetical protein
MQINKIATDKPAIVWLRKRTNATLVVDQRLPKNDPAI